MISRGYLALVVLAIVFTHIPPSLGEERVPVRVSTQHQRSHHRVRVGASAQRSIDTSNIKDVYVVFSNHLDVGFDGIDPTLGFAYNVINKYFDVYFPLAVETGKALRARDGTERLVYTTHPWLVSIYLRCPAKLYGDIHCPTPQQVSDFKEAVHAGDITWHAFGFNAQAEIYSSDLFSYGVEMAHNLDREFGKNKTRVMSQRDVPGTTIGTLPLLLKQGVKAITIGVNGASAPPVVPKAFRWSSVNGEDTVMGMLHPGGYGGISIDDCVIVQGAPVALAFAYRGDNAGPQNVTQVLAVYAQLRTEFPNSNIIASSYDEFYGAFEPYLKLLPEVKGEEIGDTWIYGCASDPLKLAEFRAQMRGRSACLQDSACASSVNGSVPFDDFNRYLLKNGEHTWGGDFKKFLPNGMGYQNWTNAQFNSVRNTAQYTTYVKSWDEQRSYLANTLASAATLPALLASVLGELSSLEHAQKAPSVENYEPFSVSRGTNYTIGKFILQIDPESGYITGLYPPSGSSFATEDRPFAAFSYETFDAQSYTRMFNQYLYCQGPSCSFATKDFGKPNVEEGNAIAQTWTPTLVKAYINSGSLVLKLAMPSNTSTLFGAPQELSVKIDAIDVDGGESRLDITLWMSKETATRLPEALWFSFIPSFSATRGATNDLTLSLSKLGTWVDAASVLYNGSRSLHGVDDNGVCWGDPSNRRAVLVKSLDSALVAPGKKSLLNFDNALPDPADGLHFNLYNNLWGTNYIMWYPYHDEDKEIGFRYQVEFPPSCPT